MEDGRQGFHSFSDTRTSSRRASGSEAIRKRVAQLFQTPSRSITEAALDEFVTINRTELHRRNLSSPGSSSCDTSLGHTHRHETNDASILSTLHPTRPVKRKKSTSSINISRHSDQSENRNAEMSALRIQSPPHMSSSRVFSALSHPPPLESDLRPFSSQKKGKALITRHPYHHQHESRLSRAQYEEDRESSYTGPIAVAEYERMRKEIETLKAALYESKKSCKKQTKILEETKSEINALTLTLQEKESEVTRVRSDHAKREELLSTIESSVQCQICMDLPDKPFALAPCGHILCLYCLQEWFRKAPPTLDDMDIEPDELTDPQYTLMRTKSCPSCRAVVKRRPVPVFMVKAIATALRSAKPSSPGSLGRPPEEAIDEDPWKGIFPSSETDEEDGRDDEDEDSSSESSEVEILTMNPPRYYGRTPLRRTIFFDSSDSDVGIGEEDGFDSENDDANEIEENESDDEEDDARLPRYVLPHWTPPTVFVSPEEYDTPADDPPDTLKLLRRGCTMEMLQNYDISYRHSTGIVLYLRSLNHLYASDDDSSEDDGDAEGMHRIYLGWSVKLHPLDVDGEMFVSDLLEDIKTEPERWQLTPRAGFLGKMDVRKLVPVITIEEYDTTDSELWAGTEDL